MIEINNLTEDQIEKNYQEFTDFISKSFTGERKSNLLKMYSQDELGMLAAMSPASSNEQYHLAHPGGYLQHVMHVVKMSVGAKKYFQIAGATIDFTDEELVFSALHHDLGKLGDKEFGEYYSSDIEDWQRKKGTMYKLNPNLPYMEVEDRTFFLLQRYGVKITWKELLALKLANGMYNKNAESYLKQYNSELALKTNLPRVVHVADYIACTGERDAFVNAGN